VAENPEAKGKGNTILNDNRLQLVIQQLVPGARKSKTPHLTAGTDIIEAQPGTDHDRQLGIETQSPESGELSESTQKTGADAGNPTNPLLRLACPKTQLIAPSQSIDSVRLQVPK
jgi:hypothetical protein